MLNIMGRATGDMHTVLHGLRIGNCPAGDFGRAKARCFRADGLTWLT